MLCVEVILQGLFQLVLCATATKLKRSGSSSSTGVTPQAQHHSTIMCIDNLLLLHHSTPPPPQRCWAQSKITRYKQVGVECHQSRDHVQVRSMSHNSNPTKEGNSTIGRTKLRQADNSKSRQKYSWRMAAIKSFLHSRWWAHNPDLICDLELYSLSQRVSDHWLHTK